MKKYICFDIGGTDIKYGLADEQGNFSAQGSMPNPVREQGTSVMLEKIAAQVEAYQAEHDEVAGVAAATAGIVDPDTGEVTFAGPSFPGYTGTKLQAFIEERCALPCRVENDVNAAGLGEFWLGSGRDAKLLFCMTVGTGIGGCIIQDGKLLHGAGNSAGEVGYMALDGGDSLETLGSTTHLVQEVAWAHHKPVQEVDGRMVFRLAHAGDADAVNALAHMIRALAAGLVNICYLLNPDTIVLGGGIMAEAKYILPRLLMEMEECTQVPGLLAHTKLLTASLGNDAGMLGALYNFQQRQQK